MRKNRAISTFTRGLTFPSSFSTSSVRRKHLYFRLEHDFCSQDGAVRPITGGWFNLDHAEVLTFAPICE